MKILNNLNNDSFSQISFPYSGSLTFTHIYYPNVIHGVPVTRL